MKPMTREEGRHRLIAILQLAHSGELAAAHAYAGHWRSVRDRRERDEIREIEEDELKHRRCVRQMLNRLGVPPQRLRDLKMGCIGRAIGLLCRLGGWFVPMYGAGKLESKNIGEYEDAARFALVGGLPEFVEELLVMAEVEWDHEAYFRDKAESHWLWRFFPDWSRPEPRGGIRRTFDEFREGFAASGPAS